MKILSKDLIVKLSEISRLADECKEALGEPKQMGKTKTKEVSLEQVRALLAEKSQDGFTAEVRELILKYGAEKLSLLDPKHYVDLMKDAEELK